MRWTQWIGSSFAILAIGAIGSACSWSAEYMNQMPPSQPGQPQLDWYHGLPMIKAMNRADRLSMADYQADVRAFAEANRQKELEARSNHWLFHFKPIQKVGQSHQTVNRTAQRNREYVVQWFCYIKGNGQAVWDHRP